MMLLICISINKSAPHLTEENNSQEHETIRVGRQSRVTRGDGNLDTTIETNNINEAKMVWFAPSPDSKNDVIRSNTNLKRTHNQVNTKLIKLIIDTRVNDSSPLEVDSC